MKTYMGVEMDPKDLPGKDELLAYLRENGNTYNALSDFAELRYENYPDNVYQQYPISVGDCNGVFLIPVREGLLSLGYNEVSSEDHEILDIEAGVMIYGKDDCQTIIDTLLNYTAGLCNAVRDACNVYGHPLEGNPDYSDIFRK